MRESTYYEPPADVLIAREKVRKKERAESQARVDKAYKEIELDDGLCVNKQESCTMQDPCKYCDSDI